MKRVSNEELKGEIKVLHALLTDLRRDIEDVKEMAPRVRSLESFRSTIKGSVAVVMALSGAIFASLKGVFGHF